MLKFQSQIYRINDIAGWNERHELRLAPEFQRRQVWSPRAKSFLIDSILRGMPLPQIFVREIVLPREKRTVRQVVDGQQRLATILEYMRGEFTILPMHNEEFAHLKYDNLPENIQREFLSFPLSVNILEGTEDRDVLEIFSRLNSYSVPLNEQEKLNAKYVGAFKKSMLDLAKNHLEFWKRHGILTAQPIARMRDVELTCELVAVMMYGLQNQKKIVGQMYKEFDDDFPAYLQISDKFAMTLQISEDILGGNISGTIFRRSSLFYSFYAAIWNCAFGFGHFDVPPHVIVPDAMLPCRERLITLSETLGTDDQPDEWNDFYESTRQSTDKLTQRQARHTVLTNILTPLFQV